jgi:hypothetical protein
VLCAKPCIVAQIASLQSHHGDVRFKVLTAMIILIMFFRFKSPYGLIGRSQRFEGAYCLDLQGRSDGLTQTGLRVHIELQKGGLNERISRHD